MQDFLHRQFDWNNRPRRYFNLTGICLFSAYLGISAVPIPNTSVKIENPVVQAKTVQTFEPSPDPGERLRECEAAIERKALFCRQKNTNSACQPWLDQVHACNKLR